MKKTIILTVFTLILLASLGYILTTNLPKPISNTNPQVNIPDGQRLMSIEDYIKQNISEFSPIKETVGGKFFVTEIKASNRAGVVSYEDGHNAYIADFIYTTDERTGIKILNFKIR